jgi:hypothetical protein
MKQEFILKLNPNPGVIDTNQTREYKKIEDSIKKVEIDEEMKDEEEDELVEPYLYEYVFIIDRSGSMSGDPIKLAA